MAARKARIEIRHSSRGVQRWWYAIVGGNNETVTPSEKFDSRAVAVSRAKRMLAITKTLSDADIVDQKEDKPAAKKAAKKAAK